MTDLQRGIRAAQAGVVINLALAVTKLAAGVVGHAYALVADAVESMADIFASMIVWGGLHISSQPADEDHPFGHGKAEALAAGVVAIMLVGAALMIALHSAKEIRTPHKTPAPWTLLVLVGVMITKWLLSRRVQAVGESTGSKAVEADAAHHLSDAVTSAAAFIGIAWAPVTNDGSFTPRDESCDAPHHGRRQMAPCERAPTPPSARPSEWPTSPSR